MVCSVPACAEITIGSTPPPGARHCDAAVDDPERDPTRRTSAPRDNPHLPGALIGVTLPGPAASGLWPLLNRPPSASARRRPPRLPGAPSSAGWNNFPTRPSSRAYGLTPAPRQAHPGSRCARRGRRRASPPTGDGGLHRQTERQVDLLGDRQRVMSARSCRWSGQRCAADHHDHAGPRDPAFDLEPEAAQMLGDLLRGCGTRGSTARGSWWKSRRAITFSFDPGDYLRERSVRARRRCRAAARCEQAKRARAVRRRRGGGRRYGTMTGRLRGPGGSDDGSLRHARCPNPADRPASGGHQMTMADGSPLRLLDVTALFSPTSAPAACGVISRPSTPGSVATGREWRHTLLVPVTRTPCNASGCSTLSPLPVPAFNYRLPLTPLATRDGTWRPTSSGIGDAFHGTSVDGARPRPPPRHPHVVLPPTCRTLVARRATGRAAAAWRVPTSQVYARFDRVYAPSLTCTRLYLRGLGIDRQPPAAQRRRQTFHRRVACATCGASSGWNRARGCCRCTPGASRRGEADRRAARGVAPGSVRPPAGAARGAQSRQLERNVRTLPYRRDRRELASWMASATTRWCMPAPRRPSG